MADEGLIDSAPGRAFHKMGGLPKVTVLEVVDTSDGQVIGIPANWRGENTPVPRVRIIERGRRSTLAVGDRALVRTEEAGKGWHAHVMKKLQKHESDVLGVLEADGAGKLWLVPVDKKDRRQIAVSGHGDAEAGQLVLAEVKGRAGQLRASVGQVLGDPMTPGSYSLIAIHKHGIPNVFTDDLLQEAEKASKLQLHADSREDLRHLPIVAIDPSDARDHDDAIWAGPDDNPENIGGWKAIVAIADVSFYVRPGSELDREARKRGNSVYFPDRVVPMLPEILSADMCSLKEAEDRAALACHIVFDQAGQLIGQKFTRAIVRLAGNIAYSDAQKAIDDPVWTPPFEPSLREDALRPLWECWRLLAKARAKREPLDLELPERRIVLDGNGQIANVSVRERLDAHRVVEDFMIAANVAAATALERKKAPVVYRVHEAPSREKLVALKDYLETFDMKFALGQVIKPSVFNAVLNKADDPATKTLITEQVLRTQMQAYYAAQNLGHFGLSLGRYAHFTSPIRRYSDLLVHRSLVNAYQMEQPSPKDRTIPASTALTVEQAATLPRICEAISATERRAMEAERDTVDRYVAAYLASRLLEEFKVRITSVQKFGLFASIVDLGGDGLVPISTLGTERFNFDEKAQQLIGESSGEIYARGQIHVMRLAEANPVTGALRFEPLPENTTNSGVTALPKSGGKFRGKRGRPSNIRHQSRRRR